MTDLRPEVADSFERLFPVPVVLADWDDVLDRAGEGRREQTKPLVRRRVVGLALALAVLLGALLVTPAFGLGERLLDLVQRGPVGGDMLHDVRSPVWSPDGRRILFTKLRVNNTFDVYVMNADGSGLRILKRRASDSTPAWSPDGQRVAVTAFARDVVPPHPKHELYVVEADGSGQRLLTRDAAEVSPAWSPDGPKIAFVGGRAGVLDVYVTNADGTGTRRLAPGVRATQDYIGPFPDPAWSPDGGKIAFVSSRAGTSEIYLMKADGSRQRRLTRNAASEFHPVWSPDGRKIAFGSRRGHTRNLRYGNDDIWVMKTDGSGARNLTRNPADDYGALWSRDGRKIFFESGRDGDEEIYVMDADGSGVRNLTRNPAHDSLSGLSPDGRKIVFVSTRDGTQEVFVMNADGSDQRKLTHRP